ncbi:MAG TPA: hypothetical protein VFU36_04190 [Jatrophihabitans sp.]|nr:hypothetical protein [Jatrophihabitans sp.]
MKFGEGPAPMMMGECWQMWRFLVEAARSARHIALAMARSGVQLALRPPLVAEPYQPGELLDRLLHRQRAALSQLSAQAVRVALRAMLATIEAVLDELDLTALVLQRVDLDRIVAAVDVDAVVARVDLYAIVDRVPIDRFLDRVDLDAVARRIDVDAVIDRADLDAVARRIDVDAVIDRVDLNLLAKRIDVDAVAARLDLDTVVARIDLVGLARYVIEAIDLPEIIRASSGSIASDAVRGVRMQTINADAQVSRIAERFRLHRRHPDGGQPDAGHPDGGQLAGEQLDGHRPDPDGGLAQAYPADGVADGRRAP